MTKQAMLKGVKNVCSATKACDGPYGAIAVDVYYDAETGRLWPYESVCGTSIRPSGRNYRLFRARERMTMREIDACARAEIMIRTALGYIEQA